MVDALPRQQQEIHSSLMLCNFVSWKNICSACGDFSLHCEMFSMNCAEYIVQCAMYNVSVHGAQCTVHNGGYAGGGGGVGWFAAHQHHRIIDALKTEPNA